MGVKIKWIGNRKIKISGNQNLKSTKHKVMFDRIESGTFIIAGALAGNRLKISGIESKILKKEITILKKWVLKSKLVKNDVIVLNSKNIKPVSIKTEPYPGFPTDLQAQIMVLMTKANGVSVKDQKKIYLKKDLCMSQN